MRKCQVNNSVTFVHICYSIIMSEIWAAFKMSTMQAIEALRS